MHTVIPLNGSSTKFTLLPGVPQFAKMEVKGREGPANLLFTYPERIEGQSTNL
jgi:hypothetical protein